MPSKPTGSHCILLAANLFYALCLLREKKPEMVVPVKTLAELFERVLKTKAIIMVKAPNHYIRLLTSVATLYVRPDGFIYAASVQKGSSNTVWAEELWQSPEFKKAMVAVKAVSQGKRTDSL